MATITGLNASRYYVDNPIWVTVDTTADANPNDPFNLTITAGSQILFNARYYPFNGVVRFDIAQIMKGLLPEPSHPVSPSIGAIQLATLTVNISMLNFSAGRTFFRGGEDSQRTNISVPSNAVLSESAKLPVWQGYPVAKYYLGSDGQTMYTNILSQPETERRRVVSCTPAYLRFLNSKGGYSFWLFEDWEIQKTAKKTSIVERRTADLDLGLQTDYSLTVSTRSEDRFVKTLEALLQSPEVYVYNIHTLKADGNPTFNSQTEWARVYNEGGNMKFNRYDGVHEFDFKFDLRTRNNPTLLW